MLPTIHTASDAQIELPDTFSQLHELAYNLWWTWSPAAHQLFHRLDPPHWQRYHNAVELLINVRLPRWSALLDDEAFHAAYRTVCGAFERYTNGGADTWFARRFADYDRGPITYFSTEYGWHESLQIYSGGLGVLSGDHCKSASDLGLPFVGVGLMYRRGYFKQTIDPDGQQQHFYREYDPARLPVRRIVDQHGEEIRVAVELDGREIALRLWKVDVGRIPVLLLDSDVETNRYSDRTITSVLYTRGREMRLCQEIVLGVGGVRALEALGIEPAVWHMNEGHSSLLALERIAGALRTGSPDFDTARAACARNVLFTTHTPVPAGNERFDLPLVQRYFKRWRKRYGVDKPALAALGRAPDGDAGEFNLTALALRNSSAANGVSRLHGEVADSMWRSLWPEGDERRIEAITNGVHTPSWLGPEVGDLLARHVGRDFLLRLADPRFPDAVDAIPDEELWAAHNVQKRRLVQFVRTRVLEQRARHGAAPSELRAIESSLLDPDALTVGFARRFATYKRADLLFRDPDRLRAILGDTERPVQVLLAGKAHPADRPGQDLIRRIVEISGQEGFAGRVVFIENYDVRVARFLVEGADLWLNTPRRPLEASGTSGMKSAANGGLNCSILDGWWCEGYDPAHGWAIGEGGEPDDERDASALYDVLAGEIIPCYFDVEDGLPRRWIARMKRALGQLIPRFSASRMVEEYAERFYVPLARQ